MDTSSSVVEKDASASTPAIPNISSVDALVSTYQQVLNSTTTTKAPAQAALDWSQAAGRFLSTLQTRQQWTQALNAVLVLPPDVLDKNKEQLLQGYCPLQLYLRFTLFQQHKDNDNNDSSRLLAEAYLEIYETLYPKPKTKQKKQKKQKKKKSKEESSSQQPLSTTTNSNENEWKNKFQDCMVKDCVALLTRAALALSADVPFASYLEGLVPLQNSKDGSSTSNQQQLLWDLLFQAFEVPNPYHRTKKRSLMDEDQFPLPKSTSEQNPKKKRKKSSSTSKINSKTIKPRLQPKNNRLLALRNTHFHARSAHNLVQMLDRKKPALSKSKVKTTPNENERKKNLKPVPPPGASTHTTPANSSILHNKNKNHPRVVTTEHSKQKKTLSTTAAAPQPQPQRRLMVSKKTKTKPKSTQQQNLLLSSPLPQFPAGRRRTSVVAETPSHPHHHHHVHWGTSTTTSTSTTSTAAAGMQQSVVAETPLPQTSKRRTSSAASFLQPMNLFED